MYRNSKHTYYILFFFENRVVYEIMWNNIVEPDRPRMTVWRMLNACSIPKAANIHSEYAILLACPLQQWLHERASMLRYTSVACLCRVRKDSRNLDPNTVWLDEIIRDLSKLLQGYYFASSYESFLPHHFQLIILSSPYHSALYKLQFPKDS
jgi:hypothetical protein